ncbi:MAG: hypothetical protein R3E79_59765 [Caldilineaceae bacterium]
MILSNRSTNATALADTTPHVRTWPDRRTLAHCLLLAGVVIGSYYGMWRAYFATLDDFGITGWVRHQATLWDALQGYGSGVRFFNYVPIWLKTRFFGLDAAPYLWSSLLQYLLLTWLVYGFARLISGRSGWALLAALLFATNYSHYEVVTHVSASDYTLWAGVYLTVLLLFALSLRRESPTLYWSAVALYGVLAFAHDFTLSLPLVLAAYQLTLGRGVCALWSLGWRDLRCHLPFWGIWAIHVGLQLQLVLAGTSEAVYSANGYAPGLHLLPNLRYLIFVAMPNMTIAPIQNFLSAHLPVAVVAGLWTGAMLLGTLFHGILLWLFWRGSARIRFALALLYLPFLQYTLWQGHFIEAPRYLLLPSIGYSLLLIEVGYTAINTVSHQARQSMARLLLLLLVLTMAGNIAVIQVWVQQHIENGHLRQAVVTTLATHYSSLTAQDQLWLEVPQAKFLDLAAACRFVYPHYVPCSAFVTGATPPESEDTETGVTYWLRVTGTGIEQIQPDQE